MRGVIQRVKNCAVVVEGRTVGETGPGLLVLLGVARSDEPADADYLAEKIGNLRIFEDRDGKMNLSLIDTRGEMMVVSQFTLLADCTKGRRPSFIEAAEPEKAESLYERFADRVRGLGIPVRTGRFRALMAVSLVNDGPVTLIVESR
jgi:D-tyrosyl-tRNA(Tyr) deacylase